MCFDDETRIEAERLRERKKGKEKMSAFRVNAHYIVNNRKSILFNRCYTMLFRDQAQAKKTNNIFFIAD